MRSTGLIFKNYETTARCRDGEDGNEKKDVFPGLARVTVGLKRINRPPKKVESRLQDKMRNLTAHVQLDLSSVRLASA